MIAGADAIVGPMERHTCTECRHDACLGSVGDCTACARHGGPCAPWGARVPRITMEQVDRWMRDLRDRKETVGNPHELD